MKRAMSIHPLAKARRGALIALLGGWAAGTLPVGAVLVSTVASVVPGSVYAQEYGNAAVVNGQPITVFRLERHFEDYLKERGRNLGNIRDPRVYKRLKREALFELVDRQLLWEAAQADQLKVPAEALDAALARIASAFRDRDGYLRRLKAAGFSEAEYRVYLERIMAGEMALAQRIDEGLTRQYPETEASKREQEFRAIYQQYKSEIDPQGALGEEAGSRLVAEQVMGNARKQVEQEVRAKLREAAKIEILLSL